MEQEHSNQNIEDASSRKIRILSFHPNIRLFFAILILNIILLFAFRMLFLVTYHSLFKGFGFTELLVALLHGLRFDFSVTFLLYSLLFVVLFLPGRWTVHPVFHMIIRSAVYIVFVLELPVCIMDLFYFGYVKRHLGAEIINIHHDTWAMVSIALYSYLIVIIIYGAFIVFLWFALKKIFKWFSAQPSKDNGIVWKKMARSFLHVLMLLAVATLAVRGGLQSKPLRVSHAFLSDNIMLGHLSLNGVFTVLQAVGKKGIRFEVPFKYDDAVDTVQKLLAEKDTVFVDREYPLLRRHVSNSDHKELPNIVIIILESWSADAAGVTGGTWGVTPNFDKLAGQGLLYTNFYSVGQRSIDAVVSLLYSFPSFSGFTIVGKAYEQNRMIGLGSALKEHGYQTLFLCGAKRDSMGFDVFAYKAGFDTYISRENYDLPADCFDGKWGVFDEHTFARADKEFKNLKEPFLGVIYTLNPHSPYDVPSDTYRKISNSKEAPFLNALYYSDWTLGEFFSKAKKSAYFDNTLFVILADHPEGHHEQSIRERFRIPCLFFFPKRIQPGTDDRVSTQLDILPSIIDFIDVDSVHASLGVSLFGTGKRTALISYGNLFGLFKNKHVLIHSLSKTIGMYEYTADPQFRTDCSGKIPGLNTTYEKELLSILKVITNTLETNKIAPLQAVPPSLSK